MFVYRRVHGLLKLPLSVDVSMDHGRNLRRKVRWLFHAGGFNVSTLFGSCSSFFFKPTGLLPDLKWPNISWLWICLVSSLVRTAGPRCFRWNITGWWNSSTEPCGSEATPRRPSGYIMLHCYILVTKNVTKCDICWLMMVDCDLYDTYMLIICWLIDGWLQIDNRKNAPAAVLDCSC